MLYTGEVQLESGLPHQYPCLNKFISKLLAEQVHFFNRKIMSRVHKLFNSFVRDKTSMDLVCISWTVAYVCLINVVFHHVCFFIMAFFFFMKIVPL